MENLLHLQFIPIVVSRFMVSVEGVEGLLEGVKLVDQVAEGLRGLLVLLLLHPVAHEELLDDRVDRIVQHQSLLLLLFSFH